MQSAGQWDRAAALLAEAARRLEAAGAQALLICANTMHRMAGEVQAAVQVPLIHVADVTAAEVRARRSRRPLLLATRYTMEQDFYRARLASRGVEVLVPDEPDRVRLQAIIYEELVRGVVRPQSKAELLRMVGAAQRDAGADGVVLACTELGLLLGPGDVEAPVFDTTEIHARAGVDFALA
jgi:aspartate racemase